MAADSITFAWEYYGSGAWRTLNVTNSNALTKTGIQDVMFTLPSDALTSGQTGKSPQVRVRISAVTNPTEGGRQSGDYVQWSEKAYQLTGTNVTFANIYTQEQADTYTILPATTPVASITNFLTLPTVEMNATTQIQLILANSTTLGAGDTVVLAGTDKFGNNISETIDVSAGNGTYNSNAWFKNLTSIACNGFTDGTITVKLKRAGMIEATGNYSYLLMGHIWVGDGSTTSSLVDNRKNVEFLPLTRFFMTQNGSVQMGETYTSSAGITTGRNGGRWVFRTNYQDAMGSPDVTSHSSNSFAFYGGSLDHSNSGYASSWITFSYGTVNLVDVSLTSGGTSASYGWKITGATPIFTRVIITNPSAFNFGGTFSSSAAFTDFIHNATMTWMHTSMSPNGVTLSGGQIAGITFQGSGNTQRLTLKNITNFSKANWNYQYTGTMNQTEGNRINYTLDLTVADSNGSAISEATVTIVDYNGNTIATLTTDVNGQITQQELKQWTRDLVNGVVQPWVQHTPHTVTISKSGYETRTIKYTMDRKREEIEVLKAAPAGYITSPQSGTGTVKVLGTEYGGSESGALYAQVLNQDGTPANGATVTITVYKSDGTAWVSSQSMTYITASNGIYKYTFTSPTDVGVYVADVSSTSPTAYGTGEFHVSQWAKNVATSSAQIANLPTSEGIWSYANRSLSSFGSLISDIWGNSTRSLTTFGTLIADIWSYTTRTLTESALSAADVWNYATRTLTDASLTSGQLATKTNVDEATSSAVLSIKTSNDYDLGDIIGYVDTLETTLGASTDTASSNTVFGKIKKVQDTVDQLSTIDTNIDTLVSKWGSYSASDIYDKVKNLSSDISAINTVSNVSSILSLSKTNETEVKEIKNKVLAMKAVVDVNRTLLEKVSNQPVIKTWLEEGSIIFKTLITNPSTITAQTVPLKYYLPRELNREDIEKTDEGLKIDYDTSQEAYYVSGEYELNPGGTKIIAVEVKDIWKISDDEVNSLRKQAEELSKPLKGTSYFAQGTLVKSDIDVSLDKILRIQKEATTPQGRIRAYREAKAEMQIVAGKLDTMKTLVASAGSMGTMFGFIGGVQTLGVWGLVIVLVGGFVFLALYIRTLNLEHHHVDKEQTTGRPGIVFLPWPTLPTLRSTVNKRAVIKWGIIAFVAIGSIMIVTNLINNRNKNIAPAGTNILQEKITVTPTLFPTSQPKKSESEKQEIQVIDEKQVLGKATKNPAVKVVVPEDDAVNIRKEPSLESEVIGKFWLSREVVKIQELDDWVKIKVNIEKDGTKYSEGWVSKEFIEEATP